VLRLVIRCENFGPLHFEHGILACILQNSENIRQIWKWHIFRQTCIVKGFVSSIKYLTGEKSIPCWQRTTTIFTFEKSFSVNGKYDINLLWKFKGKRKIIGQILFLPKNHITVRLVKITRPFNGHEIIKNNRIHFEYILGKKIKKSHNKSINLTSAKNFKGQLISEWNFGVFKSPKKPTKF
jgi:hypothetical protein